MRRRSFNNYLKIQHVGSLRRLRPAIRAQSATRQVLSALWRYPLKPKARQALLRPLDHPQALKSRAQVDDAIDCVLGLGLHPHKGAEKNWDFLAAFSAILQRHRPQDVVLDFGSGLRSVILEWLHLYGYRHLHASDLNVIPRREGWIRYTQQDLEQTTYPDAFADVITCLSVVEHGVNTTRMLAEASRVLRPNGLLLLSTDYWCEALDLKSVYDELGPVYIFSSDMLHAQLIAPASQFGLRVIGTPDLTCGDPVVERPQVPSIHQRYTFYFLAYERMTNEANHLTSMR
ncbi:MAG: class I SAM-dependent methyltransferase [Anaerolineae bacterium]|nr:class I SAM-dependent methyltransferase [Anaerolineae bacterium]MDW8172725.1 methyltransferase domain-containing protein [Anaerolineae bacterium]